MMTKVFTYFLIFFGVIGIVFLHNDFFRTDKYKQGVLKNNSNPVRSTENANICDIPTAKGLVSLQTVEKNIYNPIGYSIKQYIAPLAVVGFIEEPTCSTIFSEWAEIAKTSDPNKVPPRLMPSEIRNNYTLDGYEFTMMGYADDRGVDSPSKWNRIDHYIKSDHKDIYAGEGQAMFFAMKYHGVKGMKGFTVGSINPWLEGFALRLGAEHITTLEYRTLIISGTEKVSWVHPNEFVKNWANYAGQFDFGASFSSIEHSGLGRSGVTDISYKDRLKKLGATSLHARRDACDLTFVYKMVYKEVCLDFDQYFLKSTRSHLSRGNPFHVLVRKSRTNAAAHSFLFRVCSEWNKLSREEVFSKTSDSFHNKMMLRLCKFPRY